MKKLIFSLAVSLIATLSYAQSQADHFKEDLEYLKVNLPTNHINLFVKISQSEYEQRIASIASKADTLNAETFYNELLQLMTAIGDEHTSVYPSNFSSYLVPIRFFSYKEGMFVSTAEEPDLLLAKLIAINGVQTEEVIRQFKKIIPSENPSFFEQTLSYQILNTFTLKGMGLAESNEEVTYTFEKANGDMIQVALKPSLKPNIQAAEQYANLPAFSGKGIYWFRHYPDKNAIYVQYQSCQEDKNYPFEKFTADLFDSIAIHKPEKLILDVRYNGGGNSQVLSPFLTQLKDHYLNETGRLYVLIGKTTFSSALMNAVDLKRNFNAILVGEPTAGSVNHYGEVRSFNLPNTHSMVTYSTKYFQTWEGHDGALEPDVRIDYSIENLKKGLDEGLEYITNGK